MKSAVKFAKKAIRHILWTPEVIGRQGESSAALRLGWTSFCGYPGKILRNLYIPSGDGRTLEIDLLYLTQKGIYVVESKNYSGYIFGSESQKYWTATLYAGKNFLGASKVEKHHFYNPLWQNQAHINALRRFLQQEVPMLSVIVFSDHCEPKQIEVHDLNAVVCQQAGLPHVIRKAWNEALDVLTPEQVDALEQQLLPLTNPDPAVKQKHVREVEQRKNETYSSVPPCCPRCGGKLVIRTAKTGPHAGHQFYGCSNYPACRYIHDL